MAIYHLSAKVISRAKGSSAIACAAYRTGAQLRDEISGKTFDYSRKGGVEHCEILAPDGAPVWMLDREQLWNAVERVEKRKDAQLSREIEVSFPRELNPNQRLELIREFVRDQFVEKGMIADIGIHTARSRDGQGQPHAHVMLTLRVLTGDGFGQKNRDWNRVEVLCGWREQWAIYANRALGRAGFNERIDHRSYEAQGIDREPEPKLGPAVLLIERQAERRADRRGETYQPVTERGLEWFMVKQRNALREQAEKLSEWIERARQRLHALMLKLHGAFDQGQVDHQEVGENRRDELLGRVSAPIADSALSNKPKLLGRDLHGNPEDIPIRPRHRDKDQDR